MCSHIQEKLDAYAREIHGDVSKTMSIEQLIDSHRRLREWNIADSATRNAELQAMRERVAEQTRQAVQHGEFISLERLRAMTLGELSEFIGGF